LKEREAKLDQPGISVLRAPSPEAAAQQLIAAFPRAQMLHETAVIVASTSEELIRTAGFDIIHVPSQKLPNHHRIIHPNGVAGFDDLNLERLSEAFWEHNEDDSSTG